MHSSITFITQFPLGRTIPRVVIIPLSNNRIIIRTIFVSGSVRNSAEKVEGPGTQEAKESVNGSRAEVGPDVASKLSSLFAGLPSLAGPQRLATSLRQKFANNSGKFTNFPRSTAPSPSPSCTPRPWRPSLRSLTKLSGVPARRPVIVINKRGVRTRIERCCLEGCQFTE